MKTLVLDAMGVIFEVGDDVADLLRPFIQEHAGTKDVALVETHYREATLGHLSSEEFWKKVGVDPNLEDSYLERLRVAPGLRRFLSLAKPQVSSIWCLSNDVSEWSRKLRTRFDLDQYFDGYVISGDTGARKPDPSIYRHLLTRAHVAPSRIVFVDDRQANVDAAIALGMVGVLFSPARMAGAAVPAAADFDTLLDLLEDGV